MFNPKITLGAPPSSFLNDTNPHTGKWNHIYCLAAATFTTLTSDGRNDGSGLLVMVGTLTSISLAAGQSLYGRFTAITLSAGSVIAYEGG